MPRPVFIICSEGTSQDKDSGFLTIFQVTEKLVVAPLPPELKQGTQLIVIGNRPLHIVSTWLFEPDKGDQFGDDYEFEFHLYHPPGGVVVSVMLMNGSLKFGGPKKDFLHRIILKIEGPLPFDKPGWWRVENRIRKQGTEEEWITQDYPFEVAVLDSSEAKSDTKPA